MSHADKFRERYDYARKAGYDGTRAEFANLVMRAPALFKQVLVDQARDWLYDTDGPNDRIVAARDPDAAEARGGRAMDELGRKGTMQPGPGSTMVRHG